MKDPCFAIMLDPVQSNSFSLQLGTGPKNWLIRGLIVSALEGPNYNRGKIQVELTQTEINSSIHEKN